MPELPRRHLSLFLMKPGTTVDDAIGDTAGLTPHNLTVTPGAEARLYTKTALGAVPWWVEFLNPLAEDDLVAPQALTTSAVLAIKLAETGAYARTVCYTFGQGRHLVNLERIDRSFGLRVALNAVDPSRLRSVDARRQEDIVVNSRTQTSVGADMSLFDLDEYRDVMRRAAGGTKEQYAAVLGGLIRGSTSVTFDVPVTVNDLDARARQILVVYRKKDYQDAFPFVDYIQPVDAATAEQLDESLRHALNAAAQGQPTNYRCLYLAAPEVIDLELVEGFIYTSEWGAERTVHGELDLPDYLATRVNRTGGVTVEAARRDKVMLRHEGEVDRPLASVYRCIVAEVAWRGGAHQLVDGNWFVVQQGFVDTIRDDICQISISDLALPDILPDEAEDAYNTRTAAALGGLSLDGKNVYIGGGANRIEVCDIVLENRHLVFAKKRSRSSTLSHLWFQASVSLQTVLSDPSFRQRVRAVVEESDENFIGVFADDLSGSDHAISYAVLGVREDLAHPTDALPFFSQVALWQAHRVLRGLGVQVAIAGVTTGVK